MMFGLIIVIAVVGYAYFTWQDKKEARKNG